MASLTFFGHNLSSHGASPSDEKVGAIRNASTPKDVKEVCSFLGLAKYCVKFIPDVATVCLPIRDLARKRIKFVWARNSKPHSIN